MGQSVFGAQSASQSGLNLQSTGQSGFGTQPSIGSTQATANQSPFGTPQQTTTGQSPFGAQSTAGQSPFGAQPAATSTTSSSSSSGNSSTAQSDSIYPKLLLHTPIDQLTDSEKEQFHASKFTLGKIPVRPPPKELC